MPPTLYQILDVLPAASEQEIKAAYRQAVLRLHPDKSAAHRAPADTAKYQEVQRAWQVLNDPILRAAYDQQLALEAAQQHVFPSQTVRFNDMEEAGFTGDPGDPDMLWEYPCRCGGVYLLDDTTDVTRGSVLLPCDTCSLNIEVSGV